MKHILFTLSFVSVAGFAGGDRTSRLNSFEDLRTACAHPRRFHNQAAPTNLEISCSDVKYRWQEKDGESLALEVHHWITSSLVSDKYTVTPVRKKIHADHETAVCPLFQKVKEELSLSRTLTCDEILAYKGEATDYCGELLEEMRRANPDAIRSTETSETFNPCAQPPSDDRGQRPDDRGQRDDRCQRPDDRGQRDDRGPCDKDTDRDQRDVRGQRDR